MNKVQLHQGDCLEILKTLPDCSVDSIVTDPPYGLSFMGKRWDYDVPSTEVWAECLRVLKPGGHLLAFAGTRTQHRMAVRIEDAGFEIRDMIAWVYGSGFPKSLDVSKAIDKAAGAEHEKVLVPTKLGNTRGDRGISYASESFSGFTDISEPVTEAARQWQGWGTALKPALEPITVARKPVTGTVAANVLEHGTGALNIDGCRVETDDSLGGGRLTGATKVGEGWDRPWMNDPERRNADAQAMAEKVAKAEAMGRWPANLIHDGSDEVVAVFPQQVTKSTGGKNSKGGMGKRVLGTYALDKTAQNTGGLGDEGTPARFFYCAKANKKDRGEGNAHPTVKPTDLMAYLCRLVTPPGGVVLDPFMGSGSTGKAAMREGFRFIGCELSEEYLAIARARIEHELSKAVASPVPQPQPDLFGVTA